MLNAESYHSSFSTADNVVLLFSLISVMENRLFSWKPASSASTVTELAVTVIRNCERYFGNTSCWYFCLNLKYLGWPYRVYIKTAKNGGFCEECFIENDFKAVLATFYCYKYGANTSEAVQIIATNQKDYHKYSSCVLIC